MYGGTLVHMEDTKKLHAHAAALLADGKGILAADESSGTMGKRLEAIGEENTEDNRRTYRQLLFTAPDIEQYLSGVILYDSTIRNATDEGVPFVDLLTARGIMPGIKVDMGTVPLEHFTGEVVTQGLDDLAKRFEEYYSLGARFAKWRAVITIGDETPTQQCLAVNAVMLARYASLAQAAGLVPIVEPEVIYEGTHSIERAQEVTTQTLKTVFATLSEYRVDLSAVVLKSSMVLAGSGFKTPSTPEEVADATLRTFADAVPHEVPGIVFLSGGQTPLQATKNLQAIAQQGKQPWKLTFSYSRAIEEPVLAAWKGKPENVAAAQKVLLHRLAMNAKAQAGEYEPALEEVGGTA